WVNPANHLGNRRRGPADAINPNTAAQSELTTLSAASTANAFTISEASAWYISHADAERLCVGKASKHYQWGYSCAWCGEGLLRRCHHVACSKMGCSEVVRGRGVIPTY